MSHATTTTTARAAATTTHARRRKAFVNMPAQAGEVSLDAQGFLRLILDVSGWDGYTTISVKALAKRAGISRAQAFRFMKELRDAKLVAREWVDGEHRTYHADGFGILPPAVRITTDARCAPSGTRPEPRRTITTAPTALRPEISNVNVALPPQETIQPEPAPVAQVQAEPAPVAQVQAEPAPVAQVQAKPAPVAQVQAEPAPVAQVQAEPPPDGIDTEFDGFTVPELEAKIARMRERPRPGDGFRILLAKEVLRAKQGLPDLTPQVKAIEPRPASPRPTTTPAPPAAPPQGELKFETILTRVKGSADRQTSDDLARRLARDLKDFGSLGFYRKAAEYVRDGRLKLRLVSKARLQAKSETAEVPGAVFTRYLQDHAPELFPARSDRP